MRTLYYLYVICVYLLFVDVSNCADELERTCKVEEKQREEVDTWNTVSSSGGIVTLNKAMPDTPLLAFRGVAEAMDVHISKLLAPFSDPAVAPQWVDLLRVMRVARFDASTDTDTNTDTDTDAPRFRTTDIVYQSYDLPWPVSDRDFVFKRTWYVDVPNKRVVLEYVSEDGLDASFADEPGKATDCPAGCIRGESPLTRWVFECVPSELGSCAQTLVDVQTLVDNKGSLPPWLVNLIQRTWPYKTLSGLGALARAAGERPAVLHDGLTAAGIQHW